MAVPALLAALVALGIAAAVIWVKHDAAAPETATGTGTALIGGPFALTAADGSAVTDRDLLGTPFLIFFGFTSCPDICPATLATVASALEQLDGDAQINALFVTLDPERDTPAIAHDYATAFHPRIQGLGGTPAQIDAARAAYRVYAANIPLDDSAAGYTIDHSAFVFLMDSEGMYRRHFAPSAPAAEIAEALREEFGG